MLFNMKSSVVMLCLGVAAHGYEVNPNLRNHTIYRPSKLPGTPLPVFIWGNGGCIANGTYYALFHTAVAESGYIVIADGEPNQLGGTTPQWMLDSLNWVNEPSLHGNLTGSIDANNVISAGHSCAGSEAVPLADDPRIKLLGLYSAGHNSTELQAVHGSAYFINGGPTDIPLAYSNNVEAYNDFPAGQPKWKGEYILGHSGTFFQPGGGVYATLTTRILDYKIKGIGKVQDLQLRNWTVEYDGF